MFSIRFFEFARQAGASCRLRFAPTPSGYLHAGNALNFILNWLVARLNGGQILLRIDDLDADRKRPEYLSDIFESLHWLGLDWDEGPGLLSTMDASTEFELLWSQHHRVLIYFHYLEQLRAKNLLFACRKSRAELSGFPGGYPSEFRHQNLSLDDPDVAWRIFSDTIGMKDFVVRRRDGIPAYQIASLADDLHFGITHIVRGADLEASTAAQLFLAARLQEEAFLKIPFLHHPLLLDSTGEKLSKSAGAHSLKVMREGGGLPAAIFKTVANMLDLAPAETATDLLSSASIPFSRTRV